MDESEIAKQFIKKHKQLLYKKFVNIGKLSSITDLSSYFMAGSPGAGKTEWSKSFIKSFTEKEPNRTVVRIDPDEIREFLPNYIPKQADIFQGATALGVEKILDYVLRIIKISYLMEHFLIMRFLLKMLNDLSIKEEKWL